MIFSRPFRTLPLVLAGALAFGTVSSAGAAPAMIKLHFDPQVQQVRYHRHNAFILGAIGGLAVGAIIANQNRHYYAPADTYDAPAYDSPPPDAYDDGSDYENDPAYPKRFYPYGGY